MKFQRTFTNVDTVFSKKNTWKSRRTGRTHPGLGGCFGELSSEAKYVLSCIIPMTESSMTESRKIAFKTSSGRFSSPVAIQRLRDRFKDDFWFPTNGERRVCLLSQAPSLAGGVLSPPRRSTCCGDKICLGASLQTLLLYVFSVLRFYSLDKKVHTFCSF